MALSDYITPKKEEYILSEENGKAEVRRLLDFYEIELDGDAGEEAVKTTGAFLDELTRFYRMGKLENKEDPNLGFCVVQHTAKGSTVTYRELGGKDLDVTEGYDQNHRRSAHRALLGRLSGLGEDAINKLKGLDKQAAFGLALVFTMA